MKLSDGKTGCKGEKLFRITDIFLRDIREIYYFIRYKMRKKIVHRHPFISSREVVSKQVSVIVLKIFSDYLSKNFNNNNYYSSSMFYLLEYISF